MTICQHCGKIGGYHYANCTPPKFRIEWTGNIQVHHPIKASK